MQTATQCLEDLTQAVALRVDGHLVAELANRVRVAIVVKDKEIEWLIHEVSVKGGMPEDEVRCQLKKHS